MSYELKAGFTTEDRRLDRLPQFDPQNLRFLAVRTIESRAPRSYTWALDYWLDQGREGACVGFSFGHDGLARPVMLRNIDENYARALYHRAQQLDIWPGDDYEGTSVLAGAKAAQEKGHFKTYEWAYNVNDLILAVGYKGPAILGVNWREGMFDPGSDGFIHPTGDIAGGHAILCRAVSLKGRYFLLHNSWGKSWGVNGTAKVSFDDMASILADDGEACVPTQRRRPNLKGHGGRARISG